MNRRNFIKSASVIGAVGVWGPKSVALSALNRIGSQPNEITRSRIQDIRTRRVSIKVLDAKGHPLKHTTVQVKQLKHEFLFGETNAGMDALFRLGSSGAEKLKVSRKLFTQVFNALNTTCYWTERPRNNMAKTEMFQGEVYLDGFDDSVKWALSEGLAVKGHPLFWPVPKAIPEWLSKYDYSTQLKFLEVRLRSIVARYKGKVRLYDAVNELLWEPALKNLKARVWPYMETEENMVEYISFILKICREEDPDACFLLNDYGLERNHNEPLQLAANDNDVKAVQQNRLMGNDGKEVTAQRQRARYLDVVKRLSDMGYPPSAIGMQGHSGLITQEQQWALYDEMAQCGLPLHITEFWAKEGDFGPEFLKLDQKERQERLAEYVVQYMKNAFAHPAVDAFFFWGFMGMAVRFHDRLSPSYDVLPVFDKVRELIHKEWHTEEFLTTDAEGKIHFNGYLGDYSLRYALKKEAPLNMGIPFSVSKYLSGELHLKTLLQV